MPSLDLAGKVLTLDGEGRPRRDAPSACEPTSSMSGFFDVYSIIFLIIAVVIFMRLGSVLGRRTGNEPSPYETRVKSPPAGARNDNVVALPPRDRAAATPSETADLETLSRTPRPARPFTKGWSRSARPRRISTPSISSPAPRPPTR